MDAPKHPAIFGSQTAAPSDLNSQVGPENGKTGEMGSVLGSIHQPTVGSGFTSYIAQ